jgi:hypothetical protein
VGGNFDAPPVTNGTVVGSGTVTFTDCTNGTFTYSFSEGSGRSGSIPITRITPNAASPQVSQVRGGSPGRRHTSRESDDRRDTL